MIIKQKECEYFGVSCEKNTCRCQNYTYTVCDECKAEDKIYHHEGKQLCIDCIEKELNRVEIGGQYEK